MITLRANTWMHFPLLWCALRRQLIAVWVPSIFLCAFSAASSGQAQSIVILTTDSLTSTTRTISGLQTVIRADHANATFHVVRISSPESSARLADSIRGLRPEIIVPIGTAATSFAQALNTTSPIIFSSVLYPKMSGFLSKKSASTVVAGASLDIPFEIQFRHFQKIVPSIRRIGVLYTEITAQLIEPARDAARGIGLELVAIQIGQDREIPKALDSLLSKCDGIWSLADPRIYTPQGTKFVLLQAMKRNVPVMGFSRNVVETGALFALDFDYKAIGRQAGALVSSLLSGTPITNQEITVPDIIWFHYNQKSAAHLGITIPTEFVAIAKEVYK